MIISWYSMVGILRNRVDEFPPSTNSLYAITTNYTSTRPCCVNEIWQRGVAFSTRVRTTNGGSIAFSRDRILGGSLYLDRFGLTLPLLDICCSGSENICSWRTRSFSVLQLLMHFLKIEKKRLLYFSLGGKILRWEIPNLC